jgi:hypothetical protein
MSTIAALLPSGIASARYQASAVVEEVAVLQFLRAALGRTKGLLLAARAQADERTDDRTEVHCLVLRQIAPLDDLEHAALRLRHEQEIDDSDDALLLQSFELGQDRAVEAGAVKLEHQHLHGPERLV